LWEKRWEPRKIYLDFGTASSPVVDGGRVYVQNDNEESSFVAALDARTGRELWRTARDFGNARIKSAFSTPCVWRHRRGTEIVTLGAGMAISYDLEGKELWRLRGTSVLGAPTPIPGEDLVYVASGAQGEGVRPMFAVRAGAHGDISLAEGADHNEWVAWRLPLAGPYIPSPLLYRDRLFVLYDNGFFAAFDPRTGVQRYKARIDMDAHAFSGSPVAAGGKIYCSSEDGDVYVIDAGEQFKLLAKNTLSEMSLATPAVADGALFIRTMTKLWRIERRRPGGG